MFLECYNLLKCILHLIVNTFLYNDTLKPTKRYHFSHNLPISSSFILFFLYLCFKCLDIFWNISFFYVPYFFSSFLCFCTIMVIYLFPFSFVYVLLYSLPIWITLDCTTITRSPEYYNNYLKYSHVFCFILNL